MLTNKAIVAIGHRLAMIRDDRKASIVIRRGNAELPPQDVRVELTTKSSHPSDESASERRGGIVIAGAPSLNIAIDDRFTVGDELYRVLFVNPNRVVATLAEAEVVE